MLRERGVDKGCVFKSGEGTVEADLSGSLENQISTRQQSLIVCCTELFLDSPSSTVTSDTIQCLYRNLQSSSRQYCSDLLIFCRLSSHTNNFVLHVEMFFLSYLM